VAAAGWAGIRGFRRGLLRHSPLTIAARFVATWRDIYRYRTRGRDAFAARLGPAPFCGTHSRRTRILAHRLPVRNRTCRCRHADNLNSPRVRIRSHVTPDLELPLFSPATTTAIYTHVGAHAVPTPLNATTPHPHPTTHPTHPYRAHAATTIPPCISQYSLNHLSFVCDMALLFYSPGRADTPPGTRTRGGRRWCCDIIPTSRMGVYASWVPATVCASIPRLPPMAVPTTLGHDNSGQPFQLAPGLYLRTLAVYTAAILMLNKYLTYLCFRVPFVPSRDTILLFLPHLRAAMMQYHVAFLTCPISHHRLHK